MGKEEEEEDQAQRKRKSPGRPRRGGQRDGTERKDEKESSEGKLRPSG